MAYDKKPWKKLKMLSGLLIGDNNVSMAWYAIDLTGVYLVSEHGVSQLQFLYINKRVSYIRSHNA